MSQFPSNPFANTFRPPTEDVNSEFNNLDLGNNLVRRSPEEAIAQFTIEHLKQRHKVDGALSEPWFENAILESQYSIAHTILLNPNCAVFQEGLYEDLTPAMYRQTALETENGEVNILAAAKVVFPNGFPDSIKDIDDLQKTMLIQFGAARVLFYLNLISYVHRTEDRQDHNLITAQIESMTDRFMDDLVLSDIDYPDRNTAMIALIENDPFFRKLIVNVREELAIKQICNYMQNRDSEGGKVFLIYGGLHDFSVFLDGERMKLASFHMETSFERPLSKDKLGDILVEHGMMHGEEMQRLVIREQERILEFLARENLQIPAWQWQHFSTSALKIQALNFLDPRSLDPVTFPLSGLLHLGKRGTPELLEAITNWLAKNNLST